MNTSVASEAPFLRAAMACWRALSELTVRKLDAGRIPRQLELVEVLRLGGRREMMLVRCGAERYLVAANGEGVQSVVAVSREVGS